MKHRNVHVYLGQAKNVALGLNEIGIIVTTRDYFKVKSNFQKI